MVNFYIYYNTHTHTYIFINIRNSGKSETVPGIDRYPKYIIPLAKPVQPPVRY